ncbi:MAG: hypothetical protein ABI634_16200 [Acidobacteriota bacterium]
MTRICALTLAVSLIPHVLSGAADSASGSVVVQKLGTIRVVNAVAYIVRDQRNARATQTEILLSDVPVDPAPIRSALSPHMNAINVDVLKDRNYVLLWVRTDGSVAMNATFSKTMTQFIDDTTGRLKIAWTTNSASRLEGRLFSAAPLKTMDGTTYTVDLTFGVDVPTPEAGTALPDGGGDPGKALLALLTAAKSKNWPAIKAASGPNALKMFDRSYNSPAENAADAADLLSAWLPAQKTKITGGQLRGDVAILDVEGEMFPGQLGLSLARMVKSGNTWVFDQAAQAGMIR